MLEIVMNRFCRPSALTTAHQVNRRLTQHLQPCLFRHPLAVSRPYASIPIPTMKRENPIKHKKRIIESLIAEINANTTVLEPQKQRIKARLYSQLDVCKAEQRYVVLWLELQKFRKALDDPENVQVKDKKRKVEEAEEQLEAAYWAEFKLHVFAPWGEVEFAERVARVKKRAAAQLEKMPMMIIPIFI